MAVATQEEQTSFVKPPIELSSSSNDAEKKTVIELVEFHAKFNPNHRFCIQAQNTANGSEISFLDVTYASLKAGILACQRWLRETVKELELPVVDATQKVLKGSPVAILMDSNTSLILYMFALMGLGVPVVLFSTRLSATAIQHLLGRTGATTILVSPRLQSIVDEALSVSSAVQKESNGSPMNIDIAQNPNGLANEADAADSDLEKKNVVAYSPLTYEALLQSNTSTDSVSERIMSPYHYVSETDCHVLILHSSGTTGLPKPIYTSHRQLLSYCLCHDLKNKSQMTSPILSTSPLFHGLGMLLLWLSLGIGKPFCLPMTGSIPAGASTVLLLRDSGAKSLLTVPSILEEIALMPDNIGIDTLKELDFVAFGGGLPKESVGNMLVSAGVKLLNQYGATETGPLAPLYVPSKDYDWHYFRLRNDIWGPLRVRLDPVNSEMDLAQSWHLSLQPLGWTERFNLQDILVSRPPNSTTEFSVTGRSDDLIRLSTGEKVRPSILESALVQAEGVKTAVAFGDGQFEIGVLIEPVLAIPDTEYERFRESMWAVIEKLNEKMDFHARLSSPHAVLIAQPGSLPRSDKGTVLRREVYQRFETEIAQVYTKLDTAVKSDSLHLDSLHLDLRNLIRDSLSWKIEDRQWNDGSDFFELGMDSLQATKLRRRLAASRLQGTSDDQNQFSLRNVANDFVYQHSSITKMACAIKEKHQTQSEGDTEEDNLSKWVDSYSIHRGTQVHTDSANVLLTGTTGSLGAHLLVHLVKMPNIGRIYCLNRPSQEDATPRQKKALVRKLLSISETDWSKIEIFQCNASAPNLGLDDDAYGHLQRNITHVIHSSWPMNFKMRLASFEGQFRVLRNLLMFARDISAGRPGLRPKVLFTSSISVVGHYGEIHKEAMVPEVPVRDPSCTLSLGYAKAKLVCEQIIERTRNEFPEIEAGYVRLGQIAGSQRGFWNANEHFVAVVASSQKIERFPDLRGTMSWIPVDLAAAIVCDTVLSKESLQLVYHLENPIRQSWQDVLGILSRELKIDQRLPFQQWLDAVSAAPDMANPAKALREFLEEDFERMSCGNVILDTGASRASSPTLKTVGSVSEEEICRYLEYWRSIGVIL